MHISLAYLLKQNRQCDQSEFNNEQIYICEAILYNEIDDIE